MKIVIDTNVVISGAFFGGYPGDVGTYEGVEIITAAQFCEKYLQN